MSGSSLARRVVADAVGTALLLAAVVGSGIMASRLADGNGPFVARQLAGAVAASALFGWLRPSPAAGELRA